MRSERLSGKGACGQSVALHGGGRRCAPTPLRCSVAWPAAELASFASLTALRQPRRVRWTMRAARAATRPALLGASEARHELPARAFAEALRTLARGRAVRPSFATGAARQAASGGGDFGGEEQRRAGLGARSALRNLTHRRCLSAVSEANAASSAMRARTEQRTAVGATRRPPPYEPLPDAACRAARRSDERSDRQLP